MQRETDGMTKRIISESRGLIKENDMKLDKIIEEINPYRNIDKGGSDNE